MKEMTISIGPFEINKGMRVGLSLLSPFTYCFPHSLIPVFGPWAWRELGVILSLLCLPLLNGIDCL